MIPYDEIIKTADRRWTTRMVTRLDATDVDDEELRSLRRALHGVSDSRSLIALKAILLDTSRPERIRVTVGAALRDMVYIDARESDATLRHWWDQGDEVLRREALHQMGGLACADIVRSVAADERHPWQADALDRMAFWFDRPADVLIKVRALTHPDELVRGTAAWVVLWDEPVAAEEPLIRLTTDAHPGVARQAIRSLRYFPSRRVLRVLHDLCSHPDGKFGELASESFDEIRGCIKGALRRDSAFIVARLRTWLAPVWDLLAFTDEDLAPAPPFTPGPRPVPPSIPLKDLLTLLADPDTSPCQLSDALHATDWTVYTGAARSRLRRILLAHPDELVRERTPKALAAWGDAAGLLQLLADPSFGVRKSATFYLADLPPSPAIADAVWAYFEQRDCLGVHGTEALRTFANHADPASAIERLTPLATNRDENECLRVAALQHLIHFKATETLARLLPELVDPPTVTWAVHIELLEAIPTLELPAPDVRHLAQVDNLDLQVALAELP
jgi:hypothetical protein